MLLGKERVRGRVDAAVFEGAGIDAGVVEAAEKFRPEVKAFSPQSASGGEVADRYDKAVVAR